MSQDADDEALPPELAERLRHPDVWEQPPDDLEASVLTALRAARDADGGHDAGRPVDLSAARDRRAARRLPPRVLLAAASVVVLALLAVGLALRTSGPDAVVVALEPTPLGQGADGEATITSEPSGFAIRIDVEGLRPAPTGTYYQGWLKGPSGPVTIGTFHGREGTDAVVLWSGVDIADYPLLTITLQQEGAGAESSGQVVLSGQIP
jgi:hypothetical protein